MRGKSGHHARKGRRKKGKRCEEMREGGRRQQGRIDDRRGIK